MIALLTPTGGRKKQIQLLSQYMQRQTYDREVLWVIVDDCVPTSIDFIPDNFRPNWIIKRIFPSPPWVSGGVNTLSRNLREGICEIRKYKAVDFVLIIEDDDWYRADYISNMVDRSVGFDLVGQTHSLYFNVRNFNWNRCKNTFHASLFQTGIAASYLPQFEDCLNGEKFVDLTVWKRNARKNLFTSEDLSIGMKGMEGRKGLGFGHNPKCYRNSDSKLNENMRKRKLQELIGEDALNYLD